jgi:ATP-dependent phosphofructokinase / diphosphate-dependent phosphofructokinase
LKIGLLTGGGDSAAINAAIRVVVKKASFDDIEVLGIMSGWRGLIIDETMPLDTQVVAGIVHRSGTVLNTSRTNPFKAEDGIAHIKENITKHELDSLIVIGGEDTNTAAHDLAEYDIKCVGVPQTIDNDLPGTDYAIGFDTAASVAMDALDKLHTTASSHHRIMVLEVMGRDAGWIALIGGVAGGADTILIPEIPFDIEDVEENISKRRESGKFFSLVVVAEGSVPKGADNQFSEEQEKDSFGHIRLGGVGTWLGKELEKRTGYETRVTHLGHLQRGGNPSVFDRVLATKLGVFAVEMTKEGMFDQMACMQGGKIVAVPYAEALDGTKTVDLDFYEIAKTLY